MISDELRYLESHEWAYREPDTNTITIGLSDYAVEQLGDVVFLELPSIGDKIEKGGELGTIESIKAASDLFAPVSGEIVEINESLFNNLELFKSGSYDKNWLVRIKAEDISEFDALMGTEQYQKYIEGLE